VGTTPIGVTATDAFGNTSSGVFTVTVVDTPPGYSIDPTGRNR